jgi:DNA invertase Pin-like site-specific DNA recombinase
MIDVVELAPRDPNRTNVVGIVRVSVDHDGYSPDEQLERLRAACERDGKNLVRVHRELDVSGARPLAQRPGLRAAVAAVEDGDADEILAAYFDRLFRSLKTQAEAIERVERAGGKIGSVDFGAIGEATTAQWLSSTTIGMMAEYHSRSTRERTEPTRERLVREGKLPWPKPPRGMYLDGERRVHIDEDERETFAEVFAMRAAGESKQAVRRYLAEQGHHVTIRGVEAILGQPLYMGELRFGKRVNRHPFGDVEPITDRRTWDAVQAMKTPGGRQAPSDRLLARLGVLRCAGCGSKMVAGASHVAWTNKDGETRNTRYAFYKCGVWQECPAPCTISAANVEAFVSERAREILVDLEVQESGLREAALARRDAVAAVAAVKRARRRLMTDPDLTDEEVEDELRPLRADRERKLALADELQAESEIVEALNAARDWERLTVVERRALIRLAIARADVERGRNAVRHRVTVTPRRRGALGEQAAGRAA